MDYKRNAQTTPAANATVHAKNFIDELQKREVTLNLKDHQNINAEFRSLNKKGDLDKMSFDDLVKELNGRVPAVTAYVQRLQDADFEEITAPDSPVEEPTADDKGESGKEPSTPKMKKEPENDPSPKNKDDTKRRVGRPKVADKPKAADKENVPTAAPAISANPPTSVLDMYSAYSDKKNKEVKAQIAALTREKESAHRDISMAPSDIAIMQAFIEYAEKNGTRKNPKSLYGTDPRSYKAVIHLMMEAFLEKLARDSKTEYLAVAQKALEQERKRVEQIDEQIRKLQG